MIYLSTDRGMIRLKESRSTDPAWWEQRAHELAIEAEKEWDNPEHREALMAFGPVSFPDTSAYSSEVCYFPGDKPTNLGLGNREVHEAKPNDALFWAIRHQEIRTRRWWQLCGLHRSVFTTYIQKRLPYDAPREALDKGMTNGLIVVNGREHRIYLEGSKGRGFEWTVAWPQRSSVDFIIEV